MPRSVRLLPLASLLASCSIGSSRADFALSQIPGTTVFASEQDGAATVVNGRFRLFNNVWNKRATSGRYRQKVFVNDDNGRTIFGWVWKWRDSSGVASFPEVQVGVSPWNGEAAPDSGFPFLAGSKRLRVDYDVSLTASGSYNLAFEFWAVSALPPSKDTITHEVMIWVAGEGLGGAGVEVGRMTIAGNALSINRKQGHGDASGEHGNTWTYLALIAERPILHGPLDIGQIIDHLLTSGYLTPKHYIANLELGNEIQRGSGTTVIQNYVVRVE